VRSPINDVDVDFKLGRENKMEKCEYIMNDFTHDNLVESIEGPL
jgi:hypothetical protein